MMAMRLTAATLDEIARALRDLSKVNILVSEFEVSGHLVKVARDEPHSLQGEPSYYVTAILPKGSQSGLPSLHPRST